MRERIKIRVIKEAKQGEEREGKGEKAGDMGQKIIEVNMILR